MVKVHHPLKGKDYIFEVIKFCATIKSPAIFLKETNETQQTNKQKQQHKTKTRIMQLTVLVEQDLHNRLVPFGATFLVYQTIQKRVGRR